MMAKRKPPLLGIPQSVQISDLAQKHGYKSGSFEPKSEDERREARRQLKIQLATESLNTPAPQSGIALKHDTEVDDSWASLPVTAINFYERNPRKANNDAYVELLESIRVNGILQPLTVTKRPGDGHYILFAGGNTRLQAIRQLWEETGDLKYRETRVIVKKWRGESAVLLAHMAENTQRNDMTFWDRANGTLEIKRQLEEELQRNLTYREFESEIKKFGLQTDLRTLSMYRFAVEKLPDLGPWLSGLSIRTIQPRLNLLLKLVNHHDIEEPGFYDELVTPVCRAIAQSVLEGQAFSVDVFLRGVEVAISGKLNIEARDLVRMATAIERFPDMALDDLRKLCRPSPPPTTPALSVQQTHPASQPESAEPQKPQNNPPHAQPSTSPARPPETEVSPNSQEQHEPDDPVAPSVPEDLRTLIRSLVVKAEIGTCYEQAPGMPLGFIMGFPKDGPLDLKEHAQNRQAAWWVLAMASGQFDPEACRAGLDESNEWRSLILEDTAETLGGLELAIQHNIGGQGEFLAIPWLLNRESPIADACLALLLKLRGARP
ncbi:hypothetical protein F8A86_11710 [Betaproteobacteria bacterium SCN1]|jgi:ParB family protein of integrating conjugative element (PFGI_1 class)|nr:hypothetical protein F8A86_11710 [Betaproteobacteria bacterium SCN1]